MPECVNCHKDLPVGQRQTYLLAPVFKGAVLCKTCAQRASVRCHRCGQRILITSGHIETDQYLRLRNGRTFCKPCLEGLSFCTSCGNETDKYYQLKTRTGRKGKQICAHCAAMRAGSDWDYNPHSLNYHGTPKEGHFYGMELETDRYNSNNSCRRDLHKHHLKLDGPAFWLKPDGSLNDGIEICFHPRTIPSWTDFLISDYFTEMKDIIEHHGGKSFNTNSSGLHIHREAVGVTDETRAKLIFFVGKHREEMQKIAQRQGNSYCSYSQYSNRYTELASIARELKNGQYGGRNAMTLRSGHQTIEFRLFKGTLAPKTLVAQLGLTDALVEWLNGHPNELLEDLNRHNAMWTKFMQDLLTWRSPATPFIHEFLTRKGFYTLAIKGE